MLAAVRGGFFEIDNTPGGDESEGRGGKKRVADDGAKAKARVANDDDEEGEAPAAAPAKRAKR
jgi:hypothetical protein